MPIEDDGEGKYRFLDWYPLIAKTHYTICSIYNTAFLSHYLLIFLLTLTNSEPDVNPNSNLMMRQAGLYKSWLKEISSHVHIKKKQ